MKNISGIFAPITTPFVQDHLAVDRLRENMRKYKQTRLAGFFALGSNGESKSLSESEKLKILEVVLEEKAAHQMVMAGAGYESTQLTIEFSKKVAALGVDFVSLVTPSYFKKSLTDDALVRYYTGVADALSIPVLAYNAPGFTGMNLSAKVVQEISQHPNIAGMKDTSPGNMSSYLSVCGEHFSMLAGTISILYTAMVLGASGGVVSLGDAFPDPCCEFYEMCLSGDVAATRKLHYRLFRLNQSVSGAYGVAGVKYAMELGGYYGGNPRLPLLPLSAEGKQRIRDAAAAAGVI